MVNKYYQAGEERAAKVADLFATIAPRYDLINDLQSFGLHRVWKRRLVRLAAPKPDETALDLCCGTGDIAFALAERGAEVVGLDFSEPMLAIARTKGGARTLPVRSASEPEGADGFSNQSALVRAADGDRPRSGKSSPHPSKLDEGRAVHREQAEFQPPSFIQGDAQRIPFPDNYFDIVTVGYGLRNLASWELGLSEMRRVTKPGGRLLVLDFGKPDNALWRGIYFGYLRWCIPVFGILLCHDSQAYAYILESLKHYPAQRGVESKMKELSCQEVRTLNLLGGVMSINYGRKARA